MDNLNKLRPEDPSKAIYERLLSATAKTNSFEETLTTDERVFARITDGIYRAPSSALRELISNAYDADATSVRITTDYPRFSKISIKDDGNGLSKLSVARLIKHIGGSSKRTSLGKDVGTVNLLDTTLSPKGRKLIGKIGIGLFAVAQLTPSFRIITKQAGDSEYIVLDILLEQYKEDELKDSDDEYRSGSVRISFQTANDINEQGTEIILHHLKPAAVNELRSSSWWERARLEQDRLLNPEQEELNNVQESQNVDFNEEISTPPIYHIGTINELNKEYIQGSEVLPWKKEDSPEVKFRRLINAVMEEQIKSTENPSISKILDNYLQMIWNLSLSVPLDYIDFDPWKKERLDNFKFFKLSNSQKGQAEEITEGFSSIASYLEADFDKNENNNADFSVYIDDVKLLRPLTYENLPKNAKNSIKESLFFYGDFEQDLSRLGNEYSGGKKLKFRATAFWNSSIIPKEHRGVLIRVNNSSGNVFDSTFMGYQVSEQSRLRQIVFEINVLEGLDAAINIDRESFNFAHPHYQIIQRWVHSAIRQIVNKLKFLAKSKSVTKKTEYVAKQLSTISEVGDDEWKRVSKDRMLSQPPSIVFVDSRKAGIEVERENITEQRRNGDVVFDKSKIIQDIHIEDQTLIARVEALAKVLHGFGVFEEMDYKIQQELVRAIVRVFTTEK